MRVVVSSPAKINLFLAVTGRRPDGFHDLVSVVAPLDFGDELEAELGGGRNPAGEPFVLECNDGTVPLDDTNLILRAARAFEAATGWPGRSSGAAEAGRVGVRFRLIKRIPMGAGLGGGSSNAVAALRALNQLAGGVADETVLARIAADLGSDCALFLKNAPVVIRGRGERVEVLAEPAAARLRGRAVLLFKPSFGISTAWAYGRIAAQPGGYLPEAAAEQRLADWSAGAAPAENLLGNNLERVAFAKFVALPALVDRLRNECGMPVQMSGSGSACFALPGYDRVTSVLEARVRECWGAAAFVQRAHIAWSSALTASCAGAFNPPTP